MGGSVSRSIGGTLVDVEGLPVWLGVRGLRGEDAGAEDGVEELSASRKGVFPSRTGWGVLYMAVEESVEPSSGSVAGSEVGCTVEESISSWLLERYSEVGPTVAVVGTSMGGNVRESRVVSSKVTVLGVDRGASVEVRVSGFKVVGGAEVAGRLV